MFFQIVRQRCCNNKNYATNVNAVGCILNIDGQIPTSICHQLNVNQTELSRLLRSADYHLIRYITTKELDALISLIRKDDRSQSEINVHQYQCNLFLWDQYKVVWDGPNDKDY